MKQLEAFFSYLNDEGVLLSEYARKESFAITRRWTSTFATSQSDQIEILGPGAITEWLAIHDSEFVLLFLSSRITAFPVSQNTRPNLAYLYQGPVVNLSAFHDLEFAVFPKSLEWTLIHTHEDGAMGGPYFIRANPDEAL